MDAFSARASPSFGDEARLRDLAIGIGAEAALIRRALLVAYPAGMTSITPTTGQEVDVISVTRPQRCRRFLRQCRIVTRSIDAYRRHLSARMAESSSFAASGDRDVVAMDLVGWGDALLHTASVIYASPSAAGQSSQRCENEEGSRTSLVHPGAVSSPPTGPPASRRARHESHDAAAAIQVKEVGGKMMAVWGRFVKPPSDAAASIRNALVYVLDASSPSTLPSSIIGFYELLSRREMDVVKWPVLLVINKTANRLPTSLPLADILLLLGFDADGSGFGGGVDADSSVPEHFTVIACDTWTGHGLVDVLDWVLSL